MISPSFILKLILSTATTFPYFFVTFLTSITVLSSSSWISCFPYFPSIISFYIHLVKHFTKNSHLKQGVDHIKLLDLKTDYVFKRVFGHAGNEEITKNLLNSIIKEEITEIELDKNPILEKDLLDDKIGILDIKAKLNNNTNVDIEMQVVDHKNIEKRILFYCAKLFTSSLKSGYDYAALEKSISILITNYELENQKDIKKYITKWNLREETYPMHILTDTMEIYIIELKKFKKFKDNSNYKRLNSWIKFIESSEEEIDMSNKEIVKAKKVLEEISQDEHERYLAELREKYILDQKNIEATGYDKGLKQGKEEGKKEIAKEMIKEKIPLEVISKITKIPKEELQEIKKEI